MGETGEVAHDENPSSNTRSDSAERRLGEIVEEFAARQQAGESPVIEDFAQRDPSQADEIRQILRTLETLESTPDETFTDSAGAGISHIGNYVIERRIGHGGMGVVFLACDPELDRSVALKLLPVQATLEPRFLERFRREARAAALLQHPNIVPVYGVGQHEGLHYYAMRYIEGHSLDLVIEAVRDAQRARGEESSDASDSAAALADDLRSRDLGSSPATGSGVIDARAPTAQITEPGRASVVDGDEATYLRNVARIGAQVAEALGYAHSRGVLHRDIKPANLMLDGTGRVWVTDFGLCKLSEAEGLTMSQDLVGTMRYMAPEQMSGQADVRSDIYELGVTLYELITLAPAFPGKDSPALMHAIAHLTPQRPRKLRPGVPSDLEAIVLKATAKLPEERYGTAEAMALDLQAFVEGRPVAARPPNVLRMLEMLVRRNRLMAGASVLFAAILAIGLGSYLVAIARARREQDARLYAASIAAAEAALADNAQTARLHLDRAPPDHIDWEWNHLAARVDDSLSTFARVEGDIADIEITPDGRLVCFPERPNLLHVRELVPPHREWSAATTGGLVDRVALNASGSLVASAGGFTVQVWSLGDALRPVFEWRGNVPVSAILFGPDGEHVYIGLRNGMVHALDARTGTESTRWGGHSAWVTNLAIARTGEVVSASGDGTIRITNPKTHDARLLRGHTDDVQSVSISSDGELLVSGGDDGTVRLWNFASGELQQTWHGRENYVMEVLFAPNEELVVSASQSGVLRVWDPSQPYPLRTLRGHGNDVLSATINPDGTLFSADRDGVIKTWDPLVAGGEVVLKGHLGDTWAMVFLTKSDRLLSSNRDGTIRLWDVVSGEQLRVFLGSPSNAISLALHPDETHFATGHVNGSVRLWSIADGSIVAERDTQNAGGPPRVRGMAFSGDGSRLYALEEGRGLSLWDCVGDDLRLVRSEDVAGATAVGLAPNGRQLVIGKSDGSVVFYETDPWRPTIVATAHEGPVEVIRFGNPLGDAPWLLTGGQGGIVATWDRPAPEPTKRIAVEPQTSIQGRRILGLDLAPGGERFVVTTQASGVRIWDMERAEPLLTLRGAGRGYPLCLFSPDGLSVASASWDGPLRIWDTRSVAERRERIQPLRNHASEAAALVAQLHASESDWDGVKRALADPSLDPVLRERATRIAHRESASLEGLLARGRQLLRAPDPEPARISEATVLAYGLLKENEGDLRVQRLAGEALLRRGQLNESVGTLEGVIGARSGLGEAEVEARILLAIAYRHLGRNDKATAALQGVDEPSLMDRSLRQLYLEALQRSR